MRLGGGGGTRERTFTASVELHRDPLVAVLGQVQDVLLLGPRLDLALAVLVVATSPGPVVATAATSPPAVVASSSSTTGDDPVASSIGHGWLWWVCVCVCVAG